MVLPTVFLIHSATIRHTTGTTEDSYGNLIPTTSDTVVSCRFVASKEVMSSGSSDLGYISSVPRILLPAGTTIEDEDKIISTVAGFAQTYTVTAKNIIYEAAVNQISHINCELAAVV
jgi:hypothetical protein